MTETKHRVWDIENKTYRSNTWLVENHIILCFSGRLYQYYVNENSIVSKDVSDKYILEQYTGLKDRKYIECWEGDLRKYNGKIYKVVNETWQFVFDRNLVEFGENETKEINEDTVFESKLVGNANKNS